MSYGVWFSACVPQYPSKHQWEMDHGCSRNVCTDADISTVASYQVCCLSKILIAYFMLDLNCDGIFSTRYLSLLCVSHFYCVKIVPEKCNFTNVSILYSGKKLLASSARHVNRYPSLQMLSLLSMFLTYRMEIRLHRKIEVYCQLLKMIFTQLKRSQN